jgi:tRNA-Thr(GGU) m(6)t(6)A37 methyltransferase TsaA
MAASDGKSGWLSLSAALAFATISATAAVSVYFWRRRPRDVNERVKELEISLKLSLEDCAAERQGRIRAQQALRKAQPKFGNVDVTSYPMAPIAIIRSCFSTRNGTPRQPLLLARGRLLFDPARVPPASLEGLEEYSHCWIIYVFHLNTNLDKLWKHPFESKFKAKVRVPSLKGGKMGVFATRSPHRPCPIGLTLAKVEAVQGCTVLVSGVDLVDGTPVLDVKPYLPYSDSIKGVIGSKLSIPYCTGSGGAIERGEVAHATPSPSFSFFYYK